MTYAKTGDGRINLHNVTFIKSAAASEGLLHDGLRQVVFAGKSNVGKSSVINRILNRKNFARVGQSPGKTIHINYFLVDGIAYFVDLPGYGYAKVSKTERSRWGRLMEVYFSTPYHITLGIMIVDARHKPSADDVIMAQWFKQSNCPLVIIANKADKLKKSELEPNKELIRTTLGITAETEIILFSAEKGTNKDALITVIENAVYKN